MKNALVIIIGTTAAVFIGWSLTKTFFLDLLFVRSEGMVMPNLLTVPILLPLLLSLPIVVPLLIYTIRSLSKSEEEIVKARKK